MRTIELRSRLGRRETASAVRGWVRSLSGNNGQRATPEKKILVGAVLHGVLTANLKDFNAKSAGGQDSEGQSWKPLAPSTILRKLRKRFAGLNRGQAKRYQALVANFSRQGGGNLTSAQVRQRAVQRAWAILGYASVPINIDTGRLVASITPRQGLRRLDSATDQVVATFGRETLFWVRVPYAKHVQKVRPITVSRRQLTKYARAAAGKAIEPLAESLQRGIA